MHLLLRGVAAVLLHLRLCVDVFQRPEWVEREQYPSDGRVDEAAQIALADVVQDGGFVQVKESTHVGR